MVTELRPVQAVNYCMAPKTCWCGTPVNGVRNKKYCSPEHRASAYVPVVKTASVKSARMYSACCVCQAPYKSPRAGSRCAQCIHEAVILRHHYTRLVAEQNGVCAICRSEEVETGKFGKLRKLSVDHNHATGTLRGLLCARCNRLLGLACDDPQVLDSARVYLARHQRPAVEIPRPRVAPENTETGVAERTQLILRRRGEGVSYTAIGQQLGITRQRVTQIWERAQQPEPLCGHCWCGTVIPQTTRSGKPRKYCSPEHEPHSERAENFTRGDYKHLAEAQRYTCAICNRPETMRTRSGSIKQLNMDLDPATGSVRQLLCHSCTIMLGSINDDTVVLKQAASYLRKYSI